MPLAGYRRGVLRWQDGRMSTPPDAKQDAQQEVGGTTRDAAH
jgi:hypothetical protein